MRSKKFVYFSVAAVVVVVGLIWYFTQTFQFVLAKPELSYNCIPGKTVFNVLALSNKVEAQSTELGPMIAAINGLEQGEGKYWSFTIDGQPAQKSAMETMCIGTETITWQLK